VPSDSVNGIHIMHPDEGAGNTWGHHSFTVEFQKQASGTITPPIDPPTDPIKPPIDVNLAAQVAKNTADIERLMAWVNSFDGEM